MAEFKLPKRRILGVRIEGDRLLLNLDGVSCAVGVPPQLVGATPQQVAHWVCVSGGAALYWPDLDFTFEIKMPSLDPERLTSALRRLGVRDPEGTVTALLSTREDDTPS